MVLEYIGVHDGWADMLDEGGFGSSVGKKQGMAAAATSTATTSSGDGSRVTVKSSNSAADKFMQQCSNYKHAVYKVVTNPVMRSVWKALDFIVGPIMEEHGATIVTHKTMRGCAEWLHQMAAGDFTNTCAKHSIS